MSEKALLCVRSMRFLKIWGVNGNGFVIMFLTEFYFITIFV